MNSLTATSTSVKKSEGVAWRFLAAPNMSNVEGTVLNGLRSRTACHKVNARSGLERLHIKQSEFREMGWTANVVTGAIPRVRVLKSIMIRSELLLGCVATEQRIPQITSKMGPRSKEDLGPEPILYLLGNVQRVVLEAMLIPDA